MSNLLVDKLTLNQIRRIAGDDAIRVINSHADSISDLLAALATLQRRLDIIEAALHLSEPESES